MNAVFSLSGRSSSTSLWARLATKERYPEPDENGDEDDKDLQKKRKDFISRMGRLFRRSDDEGGEDIVKEDTKNIASGSDELEKLESELEEFESLMDESGTEGAGESGNVETGIEEEEEEEEEEKEEVIEIDYDAFYSYIEGKREKNYPAWLKEEIARNKKMKEGIMERRKKREEEEAWKNVGPDSISSVESSVEETTASSEEDVVEVEKKRVDNLKMRRKKKKIKDQLPEWAKQFVDEIKEDPSIVEDGDIESVTIDKDTNDDDDENDDDVEAIADQKKEKVTLDDWNLKSRPDSDVLRRPGDEYIRLEEERNREERARLNMEKKMRQKNEGDERKKTKDVPSVGKKAEGDGELSEGGFKKKEDAPVPDWLYAEREILKIEADARQKDETGREEGKGLKRSGGADKSDGEADVPDWLAEERDLMREEREEMKREREEMKKERQRMEEMFRQMMEETLKDSKTTDEVETTDDRKSKGRVTPPSKNFGRGSDNDGPQYRRPIGNKKTSDIPEWLKNEGKGGGAPSTSSPTIPSKNSDWNDDIYGNDEKIDSTKMRGQGNRGRDVEKDNDDDDERKSVEALKLGKGGGRRRNTPSKIEEPGWLQREKLERMYGKQGGDDDKSDDDTDDGNDDDLDKDVDSH